MTPQMSEPAPYICYACANGRHSDCQEEACKCSHRAQPSHPAAQSETPEIDAQFNECAAMGGKWDRLADLARSLERRLALAQTEIKGHMRVIDDLKADLADEAPARFQLQGALDRAQTKWQEAQARIAELEKDAARYKFLAEQHNDWHVERWIDTMRGSGTWQSIRGTALGNAIDEALKSRA